MKQNGSGRVEVVPVAGTPSTAPGRPVRYTVEVEEGLGMDESEVAATVRAALLDPRGWQRQDAIQFVNVAPAQALAGATVDIRVTLPARA